LKSVSAQYGKFKNIWQVDSATSVGGNHHIGVKDRENIAHKHFRCYKEEADSVVIHKTIKLVKIKIEVKEAQRPMKQVNR
jgi:hypothetical protein